MISQSIAEGRTPLVSRDHLAPERHFRYNTIGQWLKGNTHIHSTLSDGGKTFTQLAKIYAGAGYDFLYRTDHWVASDVGADDTAYPLLWLDGVELDGLDYCGSEYHVVCLGTFEDITREMGFCSALEAVRSQGGLMIMAHPHWMGNSIADAARWGFHGVEVYNHVCSFLNGKGDGGVYWHALLARGSDVLGFAVDDAHLRPEHPTWDGGWIVVNVSDRTRDAIDTAIRSGNFYSSCGPSFISIDRVSTGVTATCSPVRYARLVGPAHAGKRVGTPDGPLLTDMHFEIPENWPYAILEIEDNVGHRAWTNSLFTRVRSS